MASTESHFVSAPAVVDSSSTSSDPPDGGYGWVQVGVSFTINCFTWGQTASFGVYLSHYLQSNTFPTATALDYAFIGGLQFSLSMLVAPLVTLTVRRLGVKPPMLTGVALQTAGFISASFAKQIWHLYISQGLLLGVGQGFIFVAFSPIVPQWFCKKRSVAMGIGSAGSGVGGLLFSFGIQAMIDNISLGWAFRITAFITVVMNSLAVVFTRDRNATVRPPLLGFDTKLLFRYDVSLLLAWAFISMLGYMALLYSMSDFATSIGLSKQRAAAITAFLNLGTAVGRPLTGYISDRFGRIEIAGLCTFLCGFLCFAVWIPAKTYGVTILLVILSGAVVGVFWMTVGPISVEVVGLPQVPSLLSLVWLIIVPPTLFSEVIALKLRRSGVSNEYIYVEVFAGLSGIVSSLCLLELWRVIWKRKHCVADAMGSSEFAGAQAESPVPAEEK